MSRSQVLVYVHYVWSTKNREPILHSRLRRKLIMWLKENCPQNEIDLIVVNGVEDHMHALVRLAATDSISATIKRIKGASSRWINQCGFIDGKFKWQGGYGAYSVHYQEIQRVINYILDQEKHHAEDLEQLRN